MSGIRKRTVLLLIAISFIFIIFSFAVPIYRGSVFWIAFWFEIIALAMQVPFFKSAFEGRDELKSKVLGFPIFRVGYIYLTVQSVVSIILYFVGNTVKTFPIWAALLICVLICGISFIFSIGSGLARDKIEQIEESTKNNTDFMNRLKSDSAALASYTNDQSIKKALEKLAESIRYSDPVSCSELNNEEAALKEAFDTLSKAVHTGGNIEESLINEVESLLNARNIKCKALKK